MDNLLNFPTSTIVDKNVPKNAFFGRADVGQKSSLKEFLTREFESIIWLYKLSSDTLNVEDGDKVHEIDVFVCTMKEGTYNINPFCAMDGLLPRHTLFVIRYGEHTDIIMHHKERTIVRGEVNWTRGKTEMQREVDLSKTVLTIEGQSMDLVYSNLLSQIANMDVHSEEEYKEQKAKIAREEALKKQITNLETKARKEIQQRKKFELHQQILKLKKELQYYGQTKDANRK